MLSEQHPVVAKLFKFFLRLVKPFAGKARHYWYTYKTAQADGLYNSWAHSDKNRCFVGHSTKGPLISVVVPVYNPEPNHFLEMVYSATNQHYDNWELILVNGSSDPAGRAQVKAAADIDTRIKVIELKQNLGISENTNVALKAAKGEFIALFDHDDLLHPCALHCVADSLRTKTQPDLIYTDEDAVTSSSERYFGAHMKPDWSPDLLRNVNYITHLTVIRKSMIDKVGGFRKITDGAQDYDLLLRVIDECQPRIKHISRILYHWRAADASTASDINTKAYVFKAGEKALTDHLKRNRIQASVRHIAGKPGFYEVAYAPVEFSVIVGPVDPAKYKDAADWLAKLAQGTMGARTEFIVGDWYKDFAGKHRELPNLKMLPEDNSFWLSAASAATNEVIVAFKVAALPIDSDGLAKLAAAGSQLTAAPLIIDKYKTIFDAGIVRTNKLPQKLFDGYSLNQRGRNTFYGDPDWVRNVDDLTTNIVTMPTKQFIELVESASSKAYSRAEALSQLTVSDKWQPANGRLTMWGHTQFKYLGRLDLPPNSYQGTDFIRFKPVVTMVADDWGRKHERDLP